MGGDRILKQIFASVLMILISRYLKKWARS